MKFALFLGNAGKNSGGPEVYELALLQALSRIDKKNDYHVFFLFENGPAMAGPPAENFTYHTLWPSVRPVSLSASLPLALRWLRPDAIHCTFMPPVFVPPRTGYTLPCTAMFEHPDYYPPEIRKRLRFLCGIGVRNSDSVLCISEHVRGWLRENIKRGDDSLPLVPLAASETFRPMTEEDLRPVVREKYGITEPYFLFSGRWEERKNVLRIVEAFARFKRENRLPHKLVMTGERTWAAEKVDEMIQRLEIRADFIDLGKSPLVELPALYAGAEALVYPSLWESFGLPIVEAMQCGTPVITGNVSAMPETAGGAGLIVNPLDTGEIAEAMRKVAADARVRRQLRQAGLERAREFSWEKTARGSLEVYTRMAGKN